MSDSDVQSARIEIALAVKAMRELWQWCSPDTSMESYEAWSVVLEHIERAQRIVGKVII